MALIEETKIDKDRIYFHGSSEARVDHLEAPSFQHPFYVTSDLHYAMAFCTKSQSSTGDYEVKKTFTPADQNYVYVVSLKPTCQVFDFRDKISPEFKKLYNIIDKEIVDWVINSTDNLDFDDIYEFIIGLDQELLAKIENYNTYQQYYEASRYTSGKPLETIGKLIPQSVFDKAKTFATTNGIQNVSELDIHEIMAPILKKLNKLGFQGVLTKEHDYINDTSQIHATLAKVTTDYAIGVFDKAGLAMVGLVPMRYKWLKKINPDYLHNSTGETASQKIKRFIQLYRRMSMKKSSLVNESALDKKSTWYFGNNRAKNLKLSPPKWHSPFFLTTDYDYAEEYSDYGVYTITLKGEAKSKILDFDKDSDVKKLKWPKALIDDIRTGKSDLNGIAYDMYILAGHGHSREVFDKSWYLSDAAYDFDQRSYNIFDIVPKHANWASERDHRFVLQMWKDIHDAGFDGFTHLEFGKRILALFDFKCMDKISVHPVKQSTLNEGKADADGKLKIWVDDVRPAPSGYMWVKSVNEFVDVVEHAGLESVEVVDIDHDAGDFYHDGGDYIRILDYLEFLGAKDIQVRIHSANPVGVANMRRIIRKNGWTELFDVVEEDEDEFKKRFLNDNRNAFSYSLNESKATYLQKYRDEADAKKIVDAFWQIKSRLSTPQNDIDWWIKKPFADLKSFVLNYSPANKKQRRDADYRQQATDNGAKLLDTRDGYEIWYVPTYEAMRTLGRFYKGRSAKWCVASDDPEFWYDNHDEDEFIVLVREQPKNDEFDKVAVQMQGHGRYFNKDVIVLWDLENNDDTFDNGVIDNARDLIYYAWHLFKDNGELREQYYDRGEED